MEESTSGHGAASPKVREQQVDATGLWICWREAEEVLMQQLPFSAAENEESSECRGGGGGGWGRAGMLN